VGRGFLHPNRESPRCGPYLTKGNNPQDGIPISIGSDNGPDFVAKVIKQLTKRLKITWNT
jgi:hypothetical protein